MRTIKFRGKDIETGKWVYGFYVRLEDSFRKPIDGKERITHRIYTGFADSCVSQDGYDFSGDWHEIDPDTICRSTGLYDKNGKEIYEGDVIEDKKYNYKHLIRYSNDKACFTATLTKYVDDDISERFWECDVTQRWINECGKEVIGNIYDNKELLTQTIKQ